MRSSFARLPRFSTIGSKVLVGLLVASLLPLIISILLSLGQIDRMNSQSISTGSSALNTSAQQALQTQVNDLAQTTSQRMQLIANTTRELASYANYLFSHPTLFEDGMYNQAQTVVQNPDGQWANPKSEPASVFLPSTIPTLTPTMKQLLNIETFLDPLFQSLYQQDQYPSYIGTATHVLRYYPNINYVQVVPPAFDISQRPWFQAATPQNDPQHLPALSQLYDDEASKGLTITSSAPIYAPDGSFLGVVGRDITLQTILNTILPARVGQQGYTFLVGQDGNIISMPEVGQRDFEIELTAARPQDLLTVSLDEGRPLDPTITRFTKRLAQRKAGITTLSLGGQQKYLAFSPVDGTSWDVVLVRPEAEVLAPIATLNNQLDQQVTQTKLLSLGLTVGLIILAAVVAYLLSRNISQPLLTITTAARDLATGQSMYNDPTVRTLQQQMVQRNDEVGQLARAFEAIDSYFEETSQLAGEIALGNLEVTVHRTSDQDRLGTALEAMMRYLTQILQIATRLATGDLSQEVLPHSASDVLGHALKYMLDELRALVMRLQAAGREIELASTFVLQRSALLVEATEQQREQIRHATAEANQMVESNQQVAQETATLAQIAVNAQMQAQAGYQALHQTFANLHQIQKDVQDAAQRVGQLGRSSQEITRVVEVISTIAHQTNRLALDAAIHSEATGTQGRVFGVVAGNIRQLAEQAKDEANQIARLIQRIIEETNLAIKASAYSQQRVTEGMNLATSAGSALDSIARVVEQQGRLVEVINLIARQQQEASLTVAQEMLAASDISSQYSAGTLQTAQNIEQLAYLARQLKESVEAFTLPEGAHWSGQPRRTSEALNTTIPQARPRPLLPGKS